MVTLYANKIEKKSFRLLVVIHTCIALTIERVFNNERK